MNLAEILDIQPFSLRRSDKEKLLDPYLTFLSRHHFACCEPYRKMMKGIGFNPEKNYHYKDLMFLPVQMFKMMELFSVPREDIVTTVTSSGSS